MGKLSIIMIIFFIITLPACSSSNQELESLKAENERLKAELAAKNVTKSNTSTNTLRITQDANKQGINTQIVRQEFNVNDLLNEFKDWDGDKKIGQTIYTLNLKNDTYILTIKPFPFDNKKIDWVDIHYIKSLENSYSITIDELEPFQQLVSLTGINNDSWIINTLAAELPCEEVNNNWIMKIDYYIFQNKKDGIVLKLTNLDRFQAAAGKDTLAQSTADSKRKII